MIRLTIIDDILASSKIEAGMMDVESHPFESRACVDAACDVIRPRAIEKGIALSVHIDKDVSLRR